MNNEKISKGVKILPNQTNVKITHAQKLKDQFKYKEALEILSNIENVNELTVDEQISFYLPLISYRISNPSLQYPSKLLP